MKRNVYKRLLPLLSLLLFLLLTECSLFVLERFFGFNGFHLFRKKTAEHAHFHSLREASNLRSYDPLLGWRNYDTKDNPPHIKERLNANRWRHGDVNPYRKTKKRVILVGDSFLFGWYVDDTETVAHYLQTLLGEEFEVLNFAVRGYGLDQIALTSSVIASEYQPDLLIYGFINWDLARSCNTFDFGANKPRFVETENGLELRGVPVPTVEEAFAYHRSKALKNWGLSVARKSRIVSLVAQVFLQKEHKRCLTNLGPKLIAYAYNNRPATSEFLAVHLDGKLPKGFKKNVRSFVPNFLSIPPIRKQIAERLNLNPERHADGHPKPPLNRIYAQAIYNQITKQEIAMKTSQDSNKN